MKLHFPNPSRSFDPDSSRVLYCGGTVYLDEIERVIVGPLQDLMFELRIAHGCRAGSEYPSSINTRRTAGRVNIRW